MASSLTEVAGDGADLGFALLFGYRDAAERPVLRGARVDHLIYAAGLGRAHVVRHEVAHNFPEPSSWLNEKIT